MTPDNMLFIIRVLMETIRQQQEQLVDTQRRINEACQLAAAQADWAGRMAGAEEMAQDMAEWFAPVARLIRQRAGHPSYAERAAAEAEWIKPREGDYTGRLTREQYFDTGTQQAPALKLAPTERRAAA